MTARTAIGTALSAAGRALTALAAGIILAAGLSLMWWALTPSTDASMAGAMRGGVAVWGAAHFLPLKIAGTALTIRPLTLTVVVLALVAAATGRAAPVTGARLELAHAGMLTVSYGAGVLVLTAVIAPDGALGPTWYAPLIVAAIGSTGALLIRDSAVRRKLADALPPAVALGLRSAVATIGALVTGGALILAGAMVLRFPDTMAIADATAPDLAGTVGLSAIGLAFVPNAIVAAIGYASGAGFGLGDGWYSPLVVTPVDLPALPLLAVVPRGAGGGSHLALAVPALAAILAAVIIMRGVRALPRRLIASGTAAVAVGLVTAVVVAAAGGGVAGGPWATGGASVWLTAGLLAAVVLAVPALMSVATDAVPVARRLSASRTARIDDAPAELHDAGPDTQGEAVDGADCPSVVDADGAADLGVAVDDPIDADADLETDTDPDTDRADVVAAAPDAVTVVGDRADEPEEPGAASPAA